MTMMDGGAAVEHQARVGWEEQRGAFGGLEGRGGMGESWERQAPQSGPGARRLSFEKREAPLLASAPPAWIVARTRSEPVWAAEDATDVRGGVALFARRNSWGFAVSVGRERTG
jgi:hypothetical protein